MTHRERVLAALNRQPLDRFPVDLWYTPEVGAALSAHLGVQDGFEMYRALDLDKIVWVFPAFQGHAAPGGESRGEWGGEVVTQQAGDAMYIESAGPALVGEPDEKALDDYLWWPDPDRYDYDTAVNAARAASEHYAVIGPWVSFFEIYCGMRGLEHAMQDLMDDPDYVDAALDRIEAIQTEKMKRFFSRAAGSVDLCFYSDDMGSQNALLISPRMWQRHIGPRVKRWCDLIHSYGLKVFYHSDGSMSDLLPGLIEAGIDVLNPIQHICPGMEMDALKRNYGDRLIFHGGVDNQGALPFGSVQDVEQETLDCLHTLGADGQGYIACSCHNVQPGTPVENILTMIRTVQQYPL